MLPANRSESQSIGVISGDDPVSRFLLVNREVVNTSEDTHDVHVPGKPPVFVDVFAARQRGHGRDGQVVAGTTKNLHPISRKTGVCGSGQTARTEQPLRRESNRAIPLVAMDVELRHYKMECPSANDPMDACTAFQ